jgi:hypothetical protein
MGLPLAMAGTPQRCQIQGKGLSTKTTENGWRITGTCVATIPEGTPATMHLMWADPAVLHPPAAKLSDRTPGFHLFEDAGEKALLRQQAGKLNAVKPRCSATVNGRPVEVSVSDSKLYRPENVGDYKTYAEFPPLPWMWFTFDLPPGRSEVAVAIDCPKGNEPEMRAVAGWWLWAENPLQKGTLTFTCDGPLPAAPNDPLPLATHQEFDRQVLTLQPATVQTGP